MGTFPLMIVFDELDTNLVGVDLHIYVEDIGEADAPSKLLDHKTIPNVTIRGQPPVYVARLEAPPLGDNAQVSIRVHADTDRSGTMTSGDYLSTSVCALPRQMPPLGLDVRVHRI